MQEKCDKLRELLECQTDIIKRHLDRHKWFNEIPNENEGVADFITKYGWLMRELYCGYSCQSRDNCNLKIKEIVKEATN